MDGQKQESNLKVSTTQETIDSKTDTINRSKNLQEISTLIEGVLLQTQERFQTMSDQILRRIDEMAKRVDDLEKNISDLMSEAGVNEQI